MQFNKKIDNLSFGLKLAKKKKNHPKFERIALVKSITLLV